MITINETHYLFEEQKKVCIRQTKSIKRYSVLICGGKYS